MPVRDLSGTWPASQVYKSQDHAWVRCLLFPFLFCCCLDNPSCSQSCSCMTTTPTTAPQTTKNNVQQILFGGGGRGSATGWAHSFQIPAPRMKPHVARRGHTLASRTTPRPARHQVRHEHDCGRGACHRYMQLSTSQHAEYMTADSNCPSQVHHTTNTTVV